METFFTIRITNSNSSRDPSKGQMNEKGSVRARMANAQVEMSNCYSAPSNGCMKLSSLDPGCLLFSFKEKLKI